MNSAISRSSAKRSTPFSNRLNRGAADDQIDHHDTTAEFIGEFGVLVHIFHRADSDVQIMSWTLLHVVRDREPRRACR